MGEVKVELPSDLIQTHIRMAVVQALDKDNEKLVEAVVRAAMMEPAPDRYASRGKTKFQITVEEMIREEAKKVFQEWIDTNREMIREAFLKRLSKTPKKFIDTIADAFLDSMTGFSFSINWEPKDMEL